MKRPRRLLTVACVVTLLFMLSAPARSASPVAANTFGGGTITGSVACSGPTVSATGTGSVYNTVITGFIASPIRLAGTCGESFTLSVNGDAATGSTLRCPTLTGTSTSDGVTVHTEVTGQCRINNFPTQTSWLIDGTATAASFTVTRPGG